MVYRLPARFGAALILCSLFLFAFSCGGGGGDDPLDVGGTINLPDTGVPPLVIPGGSQYDGNQPGGKQPLPGDLIPVPDLEPVGDFGPNVFAVPLDSNGAGRVIAKNFSPGQKVAFVMVNTNHAFLDAHTEGTGSFPNLPDARYTISADLVQKGSSAVNDGGISTVENMLADTSYSGIQFTENSGVSPVATILEREAEAWGKTAYTPDPALKTTSSIQKGEVRTFAAVPRRIGPPVILPDPDDPDRDIDTLRYPTIYNAQDGRLVTIGAHCLIFLSTEINNGNPDTIQFTEARFNRLAREFDTVIYPNNTTAFGPVTNYDEFGVWKDLDRTVILSATDFNDSEELSIPLPGQVDVDLAAEQKIVIFVSNADAGGFFTWFQPQGDLLQDMIEDGIPMSRIQQMFDVGSTLYIGGDNFPDNDNGWEAVYSVIAHEFQHKLFHDNGLPSRNTSYGWFNEGMSMLAIHINGYTVNSGRIIDWAIDGQLTDYLTQCNVASVPMDANPFFTNQPQYGAGFLFFLYLYEHYDPGVGKRIYEAARRGVTDYISLIEIGAQTTTTIPDPGADGIVGTADDGAPEVVVENDSFENLYVKWCLANFIDGIYSDNGGFGGQDIFDPRFHYNTIDLKGTVNLATGTIVLPGVRREEFPGTGTYPVIDIHRQVLPWGADYVIFGNGDSRDLEVTVYTDPNFRMFMLPVEAYTFDQDGTIVTDPNFRMVTPGVAIN